MKNALFYFFLLASLYACRAQKNATESTSTATELSEKEKVQFGNIYMDGAKAKILGNNEASKTYFKKALSINPNSAAAHYELGLVYNQLDELDDAFDQFQLANQLGSDNYWYKLTYASFLNSRGQGDKAVKEFQELIKIRPTDVDLKYKISKLYLEQKNYKESIKYLNEIESQMGVSEDLSFLKQHIYLKDNKLESAADEIKKLIDLYPDNIKYYGILADIYVSNDKKAKALEVYKQMEEIDPNNYLVQFSMAEYYRSEGNNEQYFDAIQKAFANPDMGIDDKIKYILTFYQVNSNNQAKKAEGIALCKTIVKTHPDDAKSHALLGDFLYFDNQASAAKKEYIKTIEIDSSRFPVWNQLLVIMSETQDKEGLINYGKRAVNLFPNQPSVYLLYSLGLIDNKNYKEAIENLKMANDLVVENDVLKGQILSTIGDAYHQLEDNTNSDIYYEKALSIDSNDVYVLNNYSYYLSVRGDKLEKAERMSKRSNKLAENQSSFQDTYAWILFRLERYKEANEWIDKAIKNDNEKSGLLLEHKGDILFKLDKKKEAINFWKKASDKPDVTEELKQKIKEGESYVFKK